MLFNQVYVLPKTLLPLRGSPRSWATAPCCSIRCSDPAGRQCSDPSMPGSQLAADALGGTRLHRRCSWRSR
jgi:hypothetical protein